jgi:outer membrane protein assembly factor BamD (BamD/ComL family)
MQKYLKYLSSVLNIYICSRLISNMKKIYALILLLTIISACTSPKEKAMKEIQKLESADSTFTPQSIEEIKTAYLNFVDKYPDDEIAPVYLFRAAQRCNVGAQHQEALTHLNRIIESYPKSELAENSMFLKAYILDNSMQQYDEAVATYQLFLEKYPKSEMADDAKLAIKYIGKSPEEIWKAMGKDTSE